MSEDTTGDWWCPSCKEALAPCRVTFQERCDTCGAEVTVAGSDAARTIAELEAEIARLREELEEYASYTGRHGCLTGDCPHLNANECVKAVGATLVYVMKDAQAGWDHADKLAELSGRLDNVAEHADDCPSRINPQWACICGLDNISSELMVALAAYGASAKEL